jgi:hypothetical protein
MAVGADEELDDEADDFELTLDFSF